MAQDQTPPPKLDRLYQQRSQLDAKIKALEARKRTQARKDDTRRKIITGALALEHAQRHEAFRDILQGLIDRYVTRPQDRALFDLPPLPDIVQDNDKDASSAFASSAAS